MAIAVSILLVLLVLAAILRKNYGRGS